MWQLYDKEKCFDKSKVKARSWIGKVSKMSEK